MKSVISSKELLPFVILCLGTQPKPLPVAFGLSRTGYLTLFLLSEYLLDRLQIDHINFTHLHVSKVERHFASSLLTGCALIAGPNLYKWNSHRSEWT